MMLATAFKWPQKLALKLLKITLPTLSKIESKKHTMNFETAELSRPSFAQNVDKHVPLNWIARSIFSCLEKVFEKLPHERLFKFGIKGNILTLTRYSFREKRQCIDDENFLTERMRSQIQAKNELPACFIGFTKIVP